MSSLLKTALIGSAISLVALAGSLALPWLMGPGVSWDEAAFGYIPAGIAFVGFQLLTFFAAANNAASAETSRAATPGSTRRAILNVLAAAAVVAGGVGAGFCAVQIMDGRTYLADAERRVTSIHDELKELKAQPSPNEKQISDLEDELRWDDPSHYRDEVRFSTYCGLASGAVALAGVAWLIHAFRAARPIEI